MANGLFLFLDMLFGLCPSPALVQFFTHIFADHVYEFLFIYSLFSEDSTNHVPIILGKFKNPRVLPKMLVKYLGFMVSIKVIKIDSRNVQTIFE